MKDAKLRFTNVVANYVKYRPAYPQQVLDFLNEKCNLNARACIADVGSGTGLLSKLFLSAGMTVYGVEPNDAMRLAGEDYLRAFPNFHSIKGSAEETHLKSQTIDLVAVGTAFHWFDPQKTKLEFIRILKKNGWVALIWNVRAVKDSPFMQKYETLINTFNKDFQISNAKKFNHTIHESFFSPYPMHEASFPNQQFFDWDGLQGRLLSTSYSLQEGDKHFSEMMQTLKRIFDQYQKNGKIVFLYETKIYYGRLR